MKEVLIGKGYRENTGESVNRMKGSTWNFYRKYDSETKECLCNEKVPQFVIYHYQFKKPDGEVLKSYTISLTNESNIGWLDLEIYNLKDEDLNNIEKYERALIRMWEASWE